MRCIAYVVCDVTWHSTGPAQHRAGIVASIGLEDYPHTVQIYMPLRQALSESVRRHASCEVAEAGYLQE